MLAKLTTLIFLKITVLRLEHHDSVNDVTNKTLSLYSDYAAVVMWPKFGNSKI